MDMGCFNDDGNVEIVCSILHKEGMDGQALIIQNWTYSKFRNFMQSREFTIEETQ